MATVYKPHSNFDPPADNKRCKASVAHEGRRIGFHQCSRKTKKDGWCGLHHPDAEKKREEANEKRAEERDANSPYGWYKKAVAQRDKLLAYIKDSSPCKQCVGDHHTCIPTCSDLREWDDIIR